MTPVVVLKTGASSYYHKANPVSPMSGERQKHVLLEAPPNSDVHSPAVAESGRCTSCASRRQHMSAGAAWRKALFVPDLMYHLKERQYWRAGCYGRSGLCATRRRTRDGASSSRLRRWPRWSRATSSCCPPRPTPSTRASLKIPSAAPVTGAHARCEAITNVDHLSPLLLCLALPGIRTYLHTEPGVLLHPSSCRFIVLSKVMHSSLVYYMHGALEGRSCGRRHLKWRPRSRRRRRMR